MFQISPSRPTAFAKSFTTKLAKPLSSRVAALLSEEDVLWWLTYK
jgi:hypothetical protein